MIKWSSSTGLCDLRFTIEQARAAIANDPVTGECDANVMRLMLDPQIAVQLRRMSEESIHNELWRQSQVRNEMWAREDLFNIPENEKRLVWLAAMDMIYANKVQDGIDQYNEIVRGMNLP